MPTLHPLTRRSFLRAAGVALSLPALESLAPRAAHAADKDPVRRMVCICSTLGLMPDFWFPTKPGREYESTPYLEILGEFRNDMTIFSGVNLPGVDGGHMADSSFLTAAPHPASYSFRNSISVDQFAVERLPDATRFSSLVLSTVDSWTISVSKLGVPIPAESSPARLFRKMFIEGTPDEVAAQLRRLRTGHSILDAVRTDAKRLAQQVSPSDREKLEAYCTNVRELEERLQAAQAWEKRPKPRTTAAPLTDIPDKADVGGRVQLMFDLIHLALESDSTRVVSLRIDGIKAEGAKYPGVRESWHGCSHHGHDESKVAQLKIIETDMLQRLAGLLSRLRSTKDAAGSLLDHTMVLYGSAIGNASSHSNSNLPALLAGGGFRHGQHLAFDTKNNHNLATLYVSMLQRLGIETDTFASAKTTMKGLELA